MSHLDVNLDLLAKYGVSAPRYTSYPAIPYWHAANHTQVDGWMKGQAKGGSLSLYTHIPFCQSRCYYCGCFVVISPEKAPSGQYVDALIHEMELYAGRLEAPMPVHQYHLGGGTPNFLEPEAMRRLVNRAKALFPFAPDPEMSVEVDPRTLGQDYLALLRELGFNRISFGVQDFDLKVQKAVNRIQPYEMVAQVAQQARALGFLSVNFDLIYGLPEQTLASFQHTMEKVKTLRPDRVALYHYAHLPQSHPYQRRFAPESMAGSEEKMEIFLQARQTFLEMGYKAIGLDHFAKPDDELSLSIQNGTMLRNFMGYTTKAGSDMLSFGISAISDFNHGCWQNEKKLPHYYQALQKEQLPVYRGMKLSLDDQLRRQIIQGLFCQGGLDFAQLGQQYAINFAQAFDAELQALRPLAADGLVEVSAGSVRITDMGQLFLRNIAMQFDAYLNKTNQPAIQFSRSV